MGIMISPEKLRRFPLFAGIDDALLEKLSMISEEVEVSKDEWLFHENDPARVIYVILKGKIDIKVPINSADLYPPSLSTLGPGDVLGWSAVVEPYTYTMSALTVTDCHLIKMDSVGICELMGHHPALGYLLMSRLTRIVGDRLRDLRVRFISLVEGERWQHVEKRKLPKAAEEN